MKQWILSGLCLLFLVTAACTKSDDNPDAVIDLKNIDKTITFTHQDSIEGTCKYTRFKIMMTEFGNHSPQVDINLPAPDLMCDGFNSILADPVTSLVLVMKEGNPIYKHEAWISKNNLRLDNFAGRGEKFIGYRDVFFPTGEFQYRYGWIKVYVSADMDTIRIINMATNTTTGQMILAGQEH